MGGREAARLAALATVASSGPEPPLEDLPRLASRLLGVPIAGISLVDADRWHGHTFFGLPPDTGGIPRDLSFCDWTIRGEGLFQVPDATRDPRFADNPAVTHGPFVRAYAGVPLHVDGQPVGALCVVDRQPRTLTEEQAHLLEVLGRQASGLLELRRLRGLLGRLADLHGRSAAGAERLAAVVQDLLAASAAGRAGDGEVTAVGELLGQVGDAVAPMVADAGVPLEIEVAPGLDAARVRGRAGALTGTLVAVLRRAVATADGPVRLAVDGAGDAVTVEVRGGDARPYAPVVASPAARGPDPGDRSVARLLAELDAILTRTPGRAVLTLPLAPAR